MEVYFQTDFLMVSCLFQYLEMLLNKHLYPNQLFHIDVMKITTQKETKRKIINTISKDKENFLLDKIFM